MTAGKAAMVADLAGGPSTEVRGTWGAAERPGLAPTPAVWRQPRL